MDAPQQIDSLVSGFIAPKLKAHSFKRRRLAFARPFTHGFDVLVFQKSSWNNKHDARFTIGLGIYWSKAQEKLGRVISGTPFSDMACTVFRRIGHLIPPPKDRWWTVTDEQSVTNLEPEIWQAVEDFALPWFDRGHDIDAAIADAEEYKLTQYILALKALKHESVA
jgi:Domain of unknown function (DUF4304)